MDTSRYELLDNYAYKLLEKYMYACVSNDGKLWNFKKFQDGGYNNYSGPLLLLVGSERGALPLHIY